MHQAMSKENGFTRALVEFSENCSLSRPAFILSKSAVIKVPLLNKRDGSGVNRRRTADYSGQN